ncbi:hypothetical protein FRC0393_00257 [Corynebacterium diphtheriae]|nr:hypothetical protein FRC0383_00256 [Corynebacterium diphtheriae]CAB0876617.1 hypothetical protein FRC0393_00257 [Corynebacterium diphtheriae]
MIFINTPSKSLLTLRGVPRAGGCGALLAFLLAEVLPPPADQQQHDDRRGSEDGPHPPLPGGALPVEDGLFLRVHRHALGGDDQPVGVDAIGGAGDERDQVLIRRAAQQAGRIRGDDLNVPDLVLQLLARRGDVDRVALLDLVEVVPQGGVLQAGMSRKCGESALWWGGWDSAILAELAGCANRQVRAVKVADPAGQNAVGGAVEDRQVGLDGGQYNAAHGLGLVQDGEVIQVALIRWGALVVGAGPRIAGVDIPEVGVVLLRLLPSLIEDLWRHALFQLRVGLGGAGLLVVIPLGGEHWV